MFDYHFILDLKLFAHKNPGTDHPNCQLIVQRNASQLSVPGLMECQNDEMRDFLQDEDEKSSKKRKKKLSSNG
jgi:hypothetical protein